MKRFIESIVNFWKKEWFLIVMIITIAIIILLFELF